jgi:hypothetical protein
MLIPYPKKYTDADIARLYDEYREQDKDLKTFCAERGLPYTTIFRRFDRLEARLAKGLPPITISPSYSRGSTDVAESEVASTVQQEIAAEAKTTTEEKIVLGKILDKEIIEPLYREGLLTSSELKDKVATAQKIVELIRKGKDYEKLAEQYEEAVEALNFYRSRTEPMVRLEVGTQMLTQFLEMALLMEELGVDIIDSEAGKFYADLIQDYLMGRTKSFKA